MNRAALAAELDAIAARIDRNTPSRHDPEAFHVEKSQLRQDIRAVAETLRKASSA